MTEHDSNSGDLSDILKDRDRILMAAYALPNEGVLTDTQRSGAMDNFRTYIRLHSITPRQVAKELGSPRATTLIDLTNGVYRKNADEHIRKINMWVEANHQRRVVALQGKFVSTRVAREIHAAARMIRENATMGLVIGDTGIGKSRCLQAVHEITPGSVLTRVIAGSHHPQGLIGMLASKLGVSHAHVRTPDANNRTKIDRVIHVLRDSNRLLLIDEGHKLSRDALEVLRDIHDEADVPILISATKALHDLLLRDAQPDRGQLYSRFDIVKHLTQGFDVGAGGKPLFTVKDIVALYSVPPIRLAKDATDYLQGIANDLGHGSLRRCKIVLRNAARLARKRQSKDEGDTVTVSAQDLSQTERLLRQETAEQDIVRHRRQTMAQGA